MTAIGGLNAAISSMQAARTRLQVSASNIANAQSVAAERVDGPARDSEGRALFRPQRTVLQPAASGGVRAETESVRPPSVQRYRPDAPDAGPDGTVNRPNVSLVRETVTRIEARAQFSANLAAVETANAATGALLDAAG